MASNANSFAKTICSICYEDLKPIVEDLQAISICGHVFHELCLQQWFEYCNGGKKCSCPFCKQGCSSGNVNRLYFQSVGDQNESLLSSRNEVDGQPDTASLHGEVRRLEGKLSGLNSILERQGKEIKQLNEELYLCKEQLKKETKLRNEAVEQKATMQRLLLLKSEELDTQKLESLRLQDRNMALAKELATLKLVSDMDLEEDEVLKLASFGNDGNNKDTIDILRKSLVIRNKSYKELMAKCNQLGRGEARSSKKLEKAKEKINKLKTRMQELEMAIEIKDNEALRTLKASGKINCKEFTVNGISRNTANMLLSNDQKKAQSISADHLDLTDDKENYSVISIMGPNSIKECASTMPLDKNRDGHLAGDSIASDVFLDPSYEHQSSSDVKSTWTKPEVILDINKEAKEHGQISSGKLFGTLTHSRGNEANDMASSMDGLQATSIDDTRQTQHILNIKKESISPGPASKPGDICFSSGLLGPDGTNRYLGKWCKRSQSKGSVPVQGTTASSGDLIAVGSDGRGGRIKVLRSLNQSPSTFSMLDEREISVSTKRCKHGGKSSSLQPQGNLQIEHFFGRASH